MHIESAMLITDWLIWGLFLLLIIGIVWTLGHEHLRVPWRSVFRRRLGMIALVILIAYSGIGLLDSIHLRVSYDDGTKISEVKTVLDFVVGPLGQRDEKTYSAPFATHLYTKSLTTLEDGREVRAHAPLKHAGQHLDESISKTADITLRIVYGFLIGLILSSVIVALFILFLARQQKTNWKSYAMEITRGETLIAWREAFVTATIIAITISICLVLSRHYHILGTDKVGRDVLYDGINGIRTGLLIGTLTTIFMLPFALILGTVAGYFGGWIDDIIQYLYTTLSSIPGVLLISATILVLQVYISNHPELFPTLLQRADARLLALCIILGITSWAGLCRLLRGETLKLRSLEYIQASHALGSGNSKIIFRHIMPNVMHIVLITLVLDFSGLVLAEAVLSYVGVGVDPTTISWGNMINSSRLELAREPIVWWPLLAALILMFILVLAANLFADAVRDAFDPRLRNR